MLKLQTRHRYHQVLYNHLHGFLQTLKCKKNLHCLIVEVQTKMTRIKLGFLDTGNEKINKLFINESQRHYLEKTC